MSELCCGFEGWCGFFGWCLSRWFELVGVSE